MVGCDRSLQTYPGENGLILPFEHEDRPRQYEVHGKSSQPEEEKKGGVWVEGPPGRGGGGEQPPSGSLTRALFHIVDYLGTYLPR